MNNLFQDLRFAFRLLVKSPAFTLIAVLTMALGIGANTAIFQLFDAVRLRALPVLHPRELVDVGFDHQGEYAGHLDGRYPILTNAIWEEIRNRQQAFSGVFAWGTDTFNLSRGGQARYAQGVWLSGDAFNVLGVHPYLGRLLTISDDHKDCAAGVAVLGYWFWKREFGEAPSAVGRSISLNGQEVPIIGVTPPDFFGVEIGRRFDVAVPLCAEPVIKGEGSNLNRANAWWLAAMGRLKPGWTVDRATGHLRAISPAIFQATLPPVYDGVLKDHYLAWKLRATPVSSGDNSSLRANYGNLLPLLLLATGVLLLIACANLSNLLLARATARKREFAVRLALGASRSRLVSQLLGESAILVIVGGAAGILVSQWMSESLVALLNNADDPIFMKVTQDYRVLLFVLCVACATCILFGLAPALLGTRSNPGAALKSRSRGSSEGRREAGLRRALVVCQIAFSFALLAGALLFAGTLGNLLTMNAGFRQDGVLLASLDLTPLNLSAERRQVFKAELSAEIQSLPGVQASADQALAQWGDYENNSIRVEGQPESGPFTHNDVNYVSPGYFRTLEIPLLAGRDFDARDTSASEKVVIINQALADQFWQGGSPIGHLIYMKTFADKTAVAYRIVGVVGNAKYQDLRDDFSVITYFPRLQESNTDSLAHIYVRSSLPFSTLTSEIKNRIAGVNPAIGIEFRVLKTDIRATLLRERLLAILSGFFGFFAVVLAATGVYALMSYAVQQRTGELALRMTLGAERKHILRMVVRDTAATVGFGLLIGASLAVAAGRAASAFLYGLKAYDPFTFSASLVLLTAIAALASVLPARRATKVDPMVALRHE